MVVIQGRKRNNNNIYLWIFAAIGVLLGLWYIVANNNKPKTSDIDININTGTVVSGTDLLTGTTTESPLAYVTWANLFIDKDAKPSMDISIWADDIIFVDNSISSWENKATLTYFTCQANDPTKNCSNLVKNTNASDTFTTTHDILFAKQADGSWVWSNDNLIGYKVSVPSDQFLYDLSTVLIAINKDYIENNISSSYQNYCFDSNSSMTTILSQSTRNVADVWMTIIKWQDINGKDVTCSISTTIQDNALRLEMTDYKVEDGDTQVTTGTTQPDDTIKVDDVDKDDQTTSTTPKSVWNVPTASSSGLVFNSTRGGYSITFPSKNILYQGTNVSTNLWLDNTSCYVNIGVKAYTDRDNADIWPGVNIYECTSKLSTDTIKSQLPDYQVETSPDGSKVFLIKSNDPTWDSFANSIDVGGLEQSTIETGDAIIVQ